MHFVQKAMFISKIIWRLILVNEYHSSAPRFPGQKGGQSFQTVHPTLLRSCIETNRFEKFLLSWIKGLPKIFIRLLIKVRNHHSEGPKHFLPRVASKILLHVSGLSEQFG